MSDTERARNNLADVLPSGTWNAASPETEAQKQDRLAWIKFYRGKFKGMFTPVDEFIRKRNSGKL